MDDRLTIVLGTIGLVAFNVLLIMIGTVAVKSLELPWAIAFILPFAFGAIYADVLVCKYYVNKIKEKKGNGKANK